MLLFAVDKVILKKLVLLLSATADTSITDWHGYPRLSGYSTPDREAEYCDERVCVSVCP